MQQVTAEKWADVLSDPAIRVYHTSADFNGGYGVMYSRLSRDCQLGARGYCVGEVHYLPNGSREYTLLRSLCAPVAQGLK